MIEKRTITVTDPTTNEEKQVVKYIETVTITQEIEHNLDSIESQIAQKTNLIENTQVELINLESKRQELLAL